MQRTHGWHDSPARSWWSGTVPGRVAGSGVRARGDSARRQRQESVVRRCDDASMLRWVRSYWDEEDITFLWEVRDDGWIARSVELAGPKRRPRAAAALDELIRTRDTGGIRAVQAYETRYGRVPDKPIEDWGFPHEDISQSD